MCQWWPASRGAIFLCDCCKHGKKEKSHDLLMDRLKIIDLGDWWQTNRCNLYYIIIAQTWLWEEFLTNLPFGVKLAVSCHSNLSSSPRPVNMIEYELQFGHSINWALETVPGVPIVSSTPYPPAATKNEKHPSQNNPLLIKGKKNTFSSQHPRKPKSSLVGGFNPSEKY